MNINIIWPALLRPNTDTLVLDWALNFELSDNNVRHNMEIWPSFHKEVARVRLHEAATAKATYSFIRNRRRWNLGINIIVTLTNVIKVKLYDP